MKIIAKPRGTGKTTDLIKISDEKGYYIVCIDHNNARRTVELAKKMGLEIHFPLTYDEFLNYQWNGKHIMGFLIDDAERLFMRMLGSRASLVDTITISTGGPSMFEDLP